MRCPLATASSLLAPFSIEQAPKFFSTSIPRIAQPPRTIAIRYRDQSQGAFHATGALSQYRSKDVSTPKGGPHAHAKHSVSRAVSISVDFADCGPSSRRWNRSYKERV